MLILMPLVAPLLHLIPSMAWFFGHASSSAGTTGWSFAAETHCVVQITLLGERVAGNVCFSSVLEAARSVVL